jgi:hypothetical protein
MGKMMKKKRRKLKMRLYRLEIFCGRLLPLAVKEVEGLGVKQEEAKEVL